MVDRLKNKNGISYDKRPRIPSSSNVWSVDFSFFFFFFPLFSPRRCVFFGLFATLFFFFPPLPKVHLIPDFPLVLLVSCLLNVPESLFFFPSLSLTLVASTCWRRARGEGKDRPTRRAVHPILRRPDK